METPGRHILRTDQAYSGGAAILARRVVSKLALRMTLPTSTKKSEGTARLLSCRESRIGVLHKYKYDQARYRRQPPPRPEVEPHRSQVLLVNGESAVRVTCGH